MALFNRRKDQTISELENYYANKSNRTGMAWVMAFLSLLITVAVIAALFFGGRWIYRTITNNGDDNGAQTTVTEGTVNEDGTIVSSGERSTGTGTSGSVGAPSNGAASQPTPEFPSVVTDEAARTNTPSTTGSTAGRATTTPSTTPTTGSTTSLPNTGASELLVIGLLSGSVLGGYLLSLKRLANSR